MSSPHNPYAPPKSATEDREPEPGRAHRQGKCLVLPHGGTAPDRCIKCNRAEGLRSVTRELHWYNPLLNLLVLVNLLVLLVFARIFRKSAMVTYSLCEPCAARQKRNVRVTWALALSGVALVAAGSWASSAGPSDSALVTLVLVGGVLLLLVGLLYGLVRTRLVYAQKIDKHWVRVAGVSRDLLLGLPELP